MGRSAAPPVSPASRARRSAWSPAQRTSRSTPVPAGRTADVDAAGTPRSTPVTRVPRRISPPLSTISSAHRLRDGDEVGDRGPRRVQGRETDGVRLDLADPAGVDPPQAGHAVGARRRSRASKRPSSARSTATTSLPHSSYGDPVLGAVVLQQLPARGAQPRLEAAGLVVDPRVHDAASCGRSGGAASPVLLLEDDDPHAGRRRVSSRPIASPTMPPPTMPIDCSESCRRTARAPRRSRAPHRRPWRSCTWPRAPCRRSTPRGSHR